MNQPATSPPHVKFRVRDNFLQHARSRIERYFRMTGRSRSGGWRMLSKSATILLWLAASYTVLVFFADGWLLAALSAVSLGFSIAAVGFNIQHDAGHDAYSGRRWVNGAMALSLDLIGGSSYLWNIKHNKMHHTFTNIDGADDDIDLGVLARLSPHQRRFWFHRYQHIYLWFLYAFVVMKWHVYDDFRDVLRSRIGKFPIARPRGWALVKFIAGKCAFFALAFLIPGFLHNPWLVLFWYVFATALAGFLISTVFQLAHIVEMAAYPQPNLPDYDMPDSWGIHQMQTTVDFAPRNPALTWFLGGLNYQAEHHLFPRISHIHYPKIARLLANSCKRFHVQRHVHPTLFAGILSHARQLYQLGRPTVA